jgi:hypothetical protein
MLYVDEKQIHPTENIMKAEQVSFSFIETIIYYRFIIDFLIINILSFASNLAVEWCLSAISFSYRMSVYLVVFDAQKKIYTS